MMARAHAAVERAAARLLTWAAGHLPPARRAWGEALRAELDAIDGGCARLAWTVGGLRLLWTERRHTLMDESRAWSVLLNSCAPGMVLGVLELALLLGPWRDRSDSAIPWEPLVGFLLLYFALAGLLVGRSTGAVAPGAVAGMVTGLLAVIFYVLALVTMVRLDAIGALGGLPLFGLVGAVCGALGALVGRPLRRIQGW